MYTLPTPPNRIGPEKVTLSKVSQVGTNVDLTDKWINSPTSTLFFFISPSIKDRTSVSGNEYATAVNIGNSQILKILVAPDAGRSQMMAPAVLEVNVNGQNYPDVIDIDIIQLQKWNCIAIVKQGRLFNIYVNGVLSVTHTCTAMPIYDSTQPLRTGDPRLGGTVALMSIAPYAMQVNDVHHMMKETSDMDNKPFLSSDLPSLPNFSAEGLNGLYSMIMCPGGICKSSNKMPPPMYQWTTNYA
jgi:hypothetical protein